jgi:hypothetical protein
VSMFWKGANTEDATEEMDDDRDLPGKLERSERTDSGEDESEVELEMDDLRLSRGRPDWSDRGHGRWEGGGQSVRFAGRAHSLSIAIADDDSRHRVPPRADCNVDDRHCGSLGVPLGVGKFC